jgi:hypothetical protein
MLFSTLPDHVDMAEEFRQHPPRTTSDTAVRTFGQPIPVPGIERAVTCKFATNPSEWEDAFRLVADNYRSRGYEPANSPPLRFTPFFALPETVTLVAISDDQLVATLSLVFDNLLLGLPMECIYGDEINVLRRRGRRLVEVTCLADTDLGLREFLPVFVTLMRILTQYSVKQGADTLVITINPRHRTFYRKVLGFIPIGEWKPYPFVQNHPAEAYLVDVPMLRAHSPEMHQRIVEQALPKNILTPRPMPLGLLRYFASFAHQADRRIIQDVLCAVEHDEPSLLAVR